MNENDANRIGWIIAGILIILISAAVGLFFGGLIIGGIFILVGMNINIKK
jgi:hypothetical protein